MHVCCVLILQIISRQHFSLNPLGPLTAEYEHFISSYTSWGLKTVTYPGLSPPAHLSLTFFQEATRAYSLFGSLPNLSEFLFLPLGHLTQEWLHFPKLLMFLDLPWCWEVLCFPVRKRYPCAVALKLHPVLRMTEFLFRSWILKASPGPLLTELLDWGRQMVWY